MGTHTFISLMPSSSHGALRQTPAPRLLGREGFSPQETEIQGVCLRESQPLYPRGSR